MVGPGGAGKTRLAVEAGRRHRHAYRDGTWLVDLAAVTEPAKAGAAMLAAIGLRGAALFETSGRPRAEGSELDVLADQLDGRESLLVVDNCEHLIDAVAHLVAALLPRCAGLRVLATSREPLAIDGEALVPLAPLALPDPGDGLEASAGARRCGCSPNGPRRCAPASTSTTTDARRRGPDLRGLDGLPLALELAAARLRTLSLAELAARLSDRFRLLTGGSRTALPRHRTLRAVIDWSWDLLGENERTLAERVSVLPGGVTPESAAAVCAGTRCRRARSPSCSPPWSTSRCCAWRPTPGRYRMLETLREYGIERLADQGVLDAVRTRRPLPGRPGRPRGAAAARPRSARRAAGDALRVRQRGRRPAPPVRHGQRHRGRHARHGPVVVLADARPARRHGVLAGAGAGATRRGARWTATSPRRCSC